MGKSTISMAIFNSFLYVYQRVMSTLETSQFWWKLIFQPVSAWVYVNLVQGKLIESHYSNIVTNVNPGLINPKPRLRLFNWEGAINKYQIMTIGGIPP